MEAQKTMLVAFIIGMIAVIITLGVGILVVTAFNDSLNTDSNSSTINNPAQEVFGDGTDMITNFTNQFSTIGSIGGILLLVVLLTIIGIGGYTYGRSKGYF